MTTNNPPPHTPELTDEPPLETTINRETARISWQALAPHFAAGNMISVDTELDLVFAAKAIASDDVANVSQWMEAGTIAKTSDSQAQKWQEEDAELWAVVIKPWILVQESR